MKNERVQTPIVSEPQKPSHDDKASSDISSGPF